MLETRHVPFLPTQDAAKLVHGVPLAAHRHREGQLLYPSAGVIATTTEGAAESIDEISHKYVGLPYQNYRGVPETRLLMTIEADSVRQVGAR